MRCTAARRGMHRRRHRGASVLALVGRTRRACGMRAQDMPARMTRGHRTRTRSPVRATAGDGARRSPRHDDGAPAAVERTRPAKNFFGRSPGVAVVPVRSAVARAVVVVTTMPVRGHRCGMSPPACREARKSAPRLAFRVFAQFHGVAIHGHPDVYTSRMTSVRMIVWRGFRGASGGLRRRFGNCLFPLRNLLTRAFDSNSFRVGVTNKSRKHDCDTFHRPLR